MFLLLMFLLYVFNAFLVLQLIVFTVIQIIRFFFSAKVTMGVDYSYTQPSQSDTFGGHAESSSDGETKDLIRRDQEELGNNSPQQVHYPPQPEVEFGIPQVCYCGGQPHLASSTSRIHPGRLFYTCANVDDGDCHVWKWWDVAIMEEMRARDMHTLELAQKVDSLTLMGDYVTEQKVANLELIVSELSKKSSSASKKFEMVVAVMFVVFVVIGMVIMFK